MADNHSRVDRRAFIKKAGAAGSAVAVSSAAGCLGDGADEDVDLDDEDEAGDPFPEYTFYNNPESYNPARHDVINLIVDQWNEVGFDVEAEVLEWATLISRAVDEYDFDFTAWTQYKSPDPALNVATRWTPAHAEEPGLGNYNQYANEEVGENIDRQLAAQDQDDRIEAFHNIQNILAEEVPFTPIVYVTQLMPYRTDELEGWIEHPSGFNRIHQYTNVEPTDENEDGFLRGFWTEALENMNPWAHEGLSKHLHLQDALQMRLVNVDAELQLDPEHGLVQDFERPDETTVIYELRDDIEWSDGEQLDADDAAFTLNRVGEGDISQWTTVGGFIESAEAVDDYTVELNLTQEMGVAVNTVVGYDLTVCPEHVWSDVDQPNDELVEDPVCSGPFEVDYWEPGQEIELTARDDHPVDVSLNGIYWEIIPESSTIWSYTEDGRINYHPFAQPGRELSEGEEETENFTVERADGDGWTHLNIHTRTPGLDEVEVRQALAHAVPKRTASEQLFYGYFPVGHSYVAPAFGPLHREHEDLPFVPEGSVDAAVEHLQDSGYVVTDEGVFYPSD